MRAASPIAAGSRSYGGHGVYGGRRGSCRLLGWRRYGFCFGPVGRSGESAPERATRSIETEVSTPGDWAVPRRREPCPGGTIENSSRSPRSSTPGRAGGTDLPDYAVANPAYSCRTGSKYPRLEHFSHTWWRSCKRDPGGQCAPCAEKGLDSRHRRLVNPVDIRYDN